MSEPLPLAGQTNHGAADPLNDDHVTYVTPMRCEECHGPCGDEYHYIRGTVYCTPCWRNEVAKCNVVHATFTGEP